MDPAALDGLVPEHLLPRTRRIVLRDFAVPVDIGFHAFEVGNPQRVFVTVEVWLDEDSFAAEDRVSAAWDYDFLRTEILALVAGRRYNLQEMMARDIYTLVAARAGVKGLRIATSKPDVYPDCAAVGVDLSSF